MTDPIFFADDHEDLHTLTPPLEPLATPKKRGKGETRDLPRHSAPFSEQRRPRKSKSTRDMVHSNALESKEAPRTAPRKVSRAKKPVTTILGHQFLLNEDLASHSVPDQHSLTGSANMIQRSYEQYDDSPPSLAPIPLRGMGALADSIQPGSSAPQLSVPILLHGKESQSTTLIDAESDTDRMTIEHLKSRRDRFLRTVSLSPAIPASIQEDLDIMSGQDASNSSDDEEDFDDDEMHLETRSARGVSSEPGIHEVGRSNSGGTSASSQESLGYLDSRVRFAPEKGFQLTKSRSKESTDSFVDSAAKIGNTPSGATLSSLRASDAIIKEGMVSKKGRRGGWQHRYIAIDERRLYIFKSKNPSKPPKHVILLSFAQCKTSLNEGGKQSKWYVFDVFTPEKKFVMATPSQTETEAWVTQIQQACDGSMLDTLEASATLKRSLTNEGINSDTRSYNPELLEIRALDGNNVCCDCSATSPDWAVINLGIFVCIDCSGIHRSLGVQFSKVRSITLDCWERSHISTMRKIGNTQANSIWEKHIPPHRTKPAASAPLEERKYWIYSKYVKRSFFDPTKMNEFPSVAQTSPSPMNDQLEALKPALIELLQTDQAFRKHVRSLLLGDS